MNVCIRRGAGHAARVHLEHSSQALARAIGVVLNAAIAELCSAAKEAIQPL
jgi:hypothetical protein